MFSRASDSSNDNNNKNSTANVFDEKPPFSNISLRQGCEQSLAAALEVWAHQLLYQRGVYPREAFGPAGSYQGIAHLKACRHPQVVSYISDTVQTAVPALLDGVATELSLHIVQRDDLVNSAVVKDLEVYKWQIMKGSLDHKRLAQPKSRSRPQLRAAAKSNRDAANLEKQKILQQMNDAFRSVIQSVGRLRGHVLTTMTSNKKHNATTNHATNSLLDQISFELTLTIPQEDREKCPPLTQGFDNGTWGARSQTHECCNDLTTTPSHEHDEEEQRGYDVYGRHETDDDDDDMMDLQKSVVVSITDDEEFKFWKSRLDETEDDILEEEMIDLQAEQVKAQEKHTYRKAEQNVRQDKESLSCVPSCSLQSVQTPVIGVNFLVLKETNCNK